MNIVLIILGGAALGFVLYLINNQRGKQSAEKRKANAVKPTVEIPNDKLVVVNAPPDQVSQGVVAFLELYNAEDYVVLPRLYTISEDTYAFTFPFDVSFENFCFFINFMTYPTTSGRLAVLGWATPNFGPLVKSDYKNRKCMFFIPEDDMDFDNVYLTSEDNMCYEIGFEINGIKRQNSVLMPFEQPQYTTQSLAAYPFKDLV